MNSDPLVRYLMRLPALITFFFSVMLVTFFRELATVFDLTTNPNFDASTPADALILVSFLATLFFVVAVWLAYSLLIERFPYTLDYGVFYFDVARFSVLYLIFSFAFLAGHPPSYIYYLMTLVLWHLMMAGWHAYRLRHITGTERAERRADMRGHVVRMATYLVIAIAYVLLVVRPWSLAQPWAVHSLLVMLTSTLLVFWNARRLNNVRYKALEASKAAAMTSANLAAGA